MSQLASAASQVDSDIAFLKAAVAALQAGQQPPAPVPSPSIGFSRVIDVRDAGAKCDGSTDDTAAIQRALDTVAKPGAPNVVYIPPGVSLTGPLHFSYPGTILQGDGLMGGRSGDAKCSILQARDSSDSGPMLVADPSMLSVSRQWTRACVRGVGFNVSLSGRFTNAALPPPVISYRGVSNGCVNSEISICGNIGTAIEIVNNPAVPQAIGENTVFRNCIIYAGRLPVNGSTSRMPIAPIINIVGGDNVRFEGGLYAYDFANFPPAIVGDLTDMPMFQWAPLVLPEGVRPGFGGGIFGAAICGMPVSVRVLAADWNGESYGPVALKFRDLIVEGFSSVFQFGIGNAKGHVGFNVSRKLEVSGCQLGGTGWYGRADQPRHQLLTDKMQGGRFDLDFTPFDGDVTFGADTSGAVCNIGVNPWGGNPQAVDVSKRNRITYAWQG